MNLWGLCVALTAAWGSGVDVRLSEGTDMMGGRGANRGGKEAGSSDGDKSLETQLREPHPPSREPLALLPLYDQCFQFRERKYEYQLCAFKNVTQRELKSKGHIFVLGVWGQWLPSDSLRGLRMMYMDGESCSGDVSRSATILLQCESESFALSDVAEPSVCNYTMKFQLPIPCDLLGAANDTYEARPTMITEYSAAHQDIAGVQESADDPAVGATVHGHALLPDKDTQQRKNENNKNKAPRGRRLFGRARKGGVKIREETGVTAGFRSLEKEIRLLRSELEASQCIPNSRGFQGPLYPSD